MKHKSQQDGLVEYSSFLQEVLLEDEIECKEISEETSIGIDYFNGEEKWNILKCLDIFNLPQFFGLSKVSYLSPAHRLSA